MWNADAVQSWGWTTNAGFTPVNCQKPIAQYYWIISNLKDVFAHLVTP